MADRFTIHTSTLYDPKKKAWLEDISVMVEPASVSIIDVFQC